MLILNATLSAGCAFFALILYWRTRLWSHPGIIFAIFWALVTFFPIIGVPQLDASPRAIAFIVANVVVFGLPAFVMKWDSPKQALAGRSGFPFSGYSLLAVFLIVQVASLVAIPINLDIQGFPVLGALLDPFSVGDKYLTGRYSGSIGGNVFTQASVFLSYVGAPLGGMLVASRKGWTLRAFILVLAFAPAAFEMVLYAEKGNIFLVFAYFYGGVIVARVANGDTRLLTRTTILTCVGVAVVLVPIVALTMLNRTVGSTSGGRTSSLLGSLGAVVAQNPTDKASAPAGSGLAYAIRSYAFGHLFAFSDWFDHRLDGDPQHIYANAPHPMLGFWTFMAVGRYVDKADFQRVPPGYYAEYFLRPGVLQTNIYTYFRGLIDDFGLFGALAFSLVTGALASLLYRQMMLNVFAPLSQALFITFVGFTYSSYLISLMLWNSAYGAAAILLIVLFCYAQLHSKSARQYLVGHGNSA